MLSKLLSNISGKKITSGEEIVGGNKEGAEHSSNKEVFKSLLLSLQDQSSAGKARQQLLGLSDRSSEQVESGEKGSARENILGGSFARLGEEGDLQQVDRTILEELQKEFRNIKNQLVGDTSSEDEKKIQDQKESPESKVEAKENTSSRDGSEVSISKKLDGETVEPAPENIEPNGEMEKGEAEKESPKVNVDRPALENLKGTKDEHAKPGNKEVVSSKEDAVEKVTERGGESQKEKGRTESAGNNKKVELSPEKKEAFSKTDGSIDQREGGKNNSISSGEGTQVTGKEIEESSKQSSQKKDIESPKGSIDSRDKSFEKTQGFAERQGNPEVKEQASEGPKVKNQNVKSGKSQGGIPSEGGQTTKTEFTEQQRKTIDPFFQKNSTSSISGKGLEMKSVQNEKGKDPKGKNEGGNDKQVFGKASSEGRNKLLSRLGISSVDAQKQAKPLEAHNVTGISVVESNPNLEEQKINWEEQLSKTMDSSADKESKAGSVRLGQMPITNISLRKRILPGLTKRIQQAASSSKGDNSNWQKHNFTLDDGKNIQLSVRESKGVLQVKMGSMNLDLSKLLQQNLQQIREHLRQEFGSEVDLQFENQQQGDESQFSENTESSDRKRNYRNNFGTKGLTVETAEEISTKTVRNFGYNQMEWTA